jgi:DNA mismatch endonuclease (patch repair protein)
MGYRFRLHRRDLPGTPDIVLPRFKLVIFVHGCFWHGHPGCKKSGIPKTRTEFWTEKIRRNRERDERATEALRQKGWEVATIWECATRDPENLEVQLSSIIQVAERKYATRQTGSNGAKLGR